jgi:CheY-like chemotaxis protein
MSLDVIVCDDSSFARKQLIRTLPKSLVNNLYQAGNGLEAMEYLREHKGELLFLDLTMPGMDGYQVLEAIKNERINIMTIVVSADIQPEARKIILSYENVLEFIPKPLDKDKLLTLLTNYGLMDPNDTETVQIVETDDEKKDKNGIFDSLREKLNIAAGVTASRMAEILNLFITMPVPDVKLKKGLEVTRDIIHWLNLRDNDNQKNNIIVSQGFVGEGVLGENLLYFSPEDMNNYTHLVCDTKTTYEERVGIMIDLAGLISGTLVRVLATQFNTVIRTTHPALVPNILIDESFLRGEAPEKSESGDDSHEKPEEPFMPYNMASEAHKDGNILSVEFNFNVKGQGMSVRLDMLFTNSTMQKVIQLMEFSE